MKLVEFVPLLGFFTLLMMPFIISLFQKNLILKWAALVCSAASVGLGWIGYWWMIPWLIGLLVIFSKGEIEDK